MRRASKTVPRFAVVGLTTAALFYGLVAAGVELVNLAPPVASAIAYPLVLGFNYLLHFNWTFGVAAPQSVAVGRYLVMVALGFLLNGAIMYIGVTGLGVNYLLVQTLAMAAVISVNFVLSSFWVFRH